MSAEKHSGPRNPIAFSAKSQGQAFGLFMNSANAALKAAGESFTTVGRTAYRPDRQVYSRAVVQMQKVSPADAFKLKSELFSSRIRKELSEASIFRVRLSSAVANDAARDPGSSAHGRAAVVQGGGKPRINSTCHA